MQKTKMIFTLGPSVDSEAVLASLIEAGMSCSRHNFSHGTYEEHRKRIEAVKRLRERYGRPIGIMLDTKGPEIRTGFFPNQVELSEGSRFTIICGEDIEGDAEKCGVSYLELYRDVAPGNLILIADGLVGLEVREIEGTKIHCTVKNSGVIGTRKNVNIPNVKSNLPSITEKDYEDLKFGCEMGVDYVAASFIRKAADVAAVRRILESFHGEGIQVISKIENQEGVDNIDEIIRLSDGIMVARGDMGTEIPIEKVPMIQKMIIEKCNRAGKFVVTATQMLDSMERNPRPTRAEASDIANAIFDGTDAIMLSGETASGKYPVEAANTMARIAREAEERLDYRSLLNAKKECHIKNVPNAISLATCTTAAEVNASAIITVTQSGQTARIVSKFRPSCPIIAVTTNDRVLQGLSLNWGVFPVGAPIFRSTDELIDQSIDISLETGYVEKGDLVVLVAGIPISLYGSTNMLKVHVIGDILLKGKGAGTRPGYGTVKAFQDFNKARALAGKEDILLVSRLEAKDFSLLDKVAGIISEEDGPTSDLAVECALKNIPLICGAKGASEKIPDGSAVTLDVRRGFIYSGKVNIT